MKAAHEAHSAAFRQFHEAMTAPSIDRARLESLRAEQIKSFDETSKRLVTAISDAAEVLTPEQRAALAKTDRGAPPRLACRQVSGRNMQLMTARVLLVEDDARLASMVADYLGEAGFRVGRGADRRRRDAPRRHRTISTRSFST